MANWIITDSVNLRQPTHYAHGAVAEDLMLPGDNKAHTWEVAVRDGDADADLSGKSCYAYFVRKDNTKVLVNGTITGNVCSVTLHSTCYAVPGFLRAVMILSATGETTAIYEKTFRVNPALPDQTVDPGETIPSLDDLLAEIGAMRLATSETIAATNAARTATTAANTATQNANTKAEAAQTAANNANQATTAANQATANANTATQNANAKAEQAQTAANNADQATAAATAATAAAQTATVDANNAAQNANTAASTITNQIDRLDAVDRKQNARLSNLEAASEGYLYNVVEDSETAYSKTVPNGTLPYANLDMVGGKTLVWNQYMGDHNMKTVVSEGVTYTYANGVFTANGTSTGISYVSNSGIFEFVKGHTYFYKSLTKQGSSETFYAYITGNAFSNVTNDYGNGAYGVADVGGIGFIVLARYANGFTANGDTFIPQLFDLTQMFGAGNEPTADEFRAMFPADYYPYSEPTLMSFSADKVVSKGRNLVDLSEFNFADNAYTHNYNIVAYQAAVELKKVFTENVGKEISYTVTTIGTQASGMARIGQLRIYAEGDNILTVNPNSKFVVPDSIASATIFIVYGSINGATVKDYQFALTDDILPYVPYRDPIVNDLSTLVQKYFPDGMKSAGDVHDEIDLERGMAVKRVGSVDLGNQSWDHYVSITDRNIYSSGTIAGMKPAQAKCTCAEYKWRRWDALNVMAELEVWTHPSLPYAYICDSRYTNGLEFRNAVSGVMFYYELATPVETPIDPADLADLAVLNVETGGSLTFVNQHGDDYRVPLPSQETFMIKLGGEQA